MPTGSSTSARPPARAAGGCSTPGRSPGLEQVAESVTSAHLFGRAEKRPARPAHAARLAAPRRRHPAQPQDVSLDVPLGVMTPSPGCPGSGKSTLVAQVLAEVVRRHLGQAAERRRGRRRRGRTARRRRRPRGGLESFDRLVVVDQRPIGRTPRSNLATYTGLFDAVRKLYAATPRPRARLRRRPVLLQRRRRALRDLPGRGLRRRSSWSSCRAPTRRAPPATARATTPRRWR